MPGDYSKCSSGFSSRIIPLITSSSFLFKCLSRRAGGERGALFVTMVLV